jgi:hypothetical protein
MLEFEDEKRISWAEIFENPLIKSWIFIYFLINSYCLSLKVNI